MKVEVDLDGCEAHGICESPCSSGRDGSQVGTLGVFASKPA